MNLALRLIAVGVIVLASVLYADAVQISARRIDLAAYNRGRAAVALVVDLRAIASDLDRYERGGALGHDAAVRSIQAEIARIQDEATKVSADTLLGPDWARIRSDWQAEAAGHGSPDLLADTRAALRGLFMRVGEIALTSGGASNLNGSLDEAALLGLPVASNQMRQLVSAVENGALRSGTRAPAGETMAEAYARGRLLVSLASAGVESPWDATLPAIVKAQADGAFGSATAFLDELAADIDRGAIPPAGRAAFVARGRDAEQRMSDLEATLLPLLDRRFAGAADRARREIALTIVLTAAIITIIELLSWQVLRSQERSRRSRDELEHQALHDALTGLPNRRAFVEAAAAAVSAWTPINDRTTWALSIDLDYFKEVNDRYGHQTGDAFLVAAAQRLRASTPPEDLVARVGGDEFAVLVRHYDPDSAHALRVAQRICNAFAAPIVVDGVVHRLSASVGMVGVDALHETVDSLLRDADIAMYRAKEDGGSRVVLFDDALRATIVDRAELAADLRTALTRGSGPRVVFQPIISLDGGACYGFEALVRWTHPERGEIDAGWLIDVAQEARLIAPLGRLVIYEVCRHLAGWRDDGLTLEGLSVHINVSPMEAAHPEMFSAIANAIETFGIPAQTLVVELTETAAFESEDTTGHFLTGMRAIGVRVCLDDFGTGFSSLAHLNDFQVDAIKIDRSFVVTAAADPSKTPIVAGIIALARGLNAEVIAEGIETLAQRTLLDNLGCTLVQGYLFARPMQSSDAFRFAQRAVALRPAVGS